MFIPKEPNIMSFEDLNEYLLDLENRVSTAIRNPQVESINFTPLAVAPDKPRAGDLIGVDGNNFNPGSGAGLYHYITNYIKV